MQADSHLLNKADRNLYSSVMKSIETAKPDFFIDLGDTFLNDKDLDIPFSTINDIYYEQVPYLSTVAKGSSLFLVIGNHEGEYGYFLDGTRDNMSVYAALSRKQYYPNPIPNKFYSGNTVEEEFIGQPENYYAFTWGDALFVALDPYRYTVLDPKQTKDNWNWTLGELQYQWLKNTLENSKAKYKFVFAHHAIGNIRGGAKVASLYEWGGEDQKGKWLFDQKRPGWEKPIHQLMVDNDVTIFFQGHDHVFAREEVDGVIYQTLPKSAEMVPDQQNNYLFYSGGDVQINSGYLEVMVQPEHVQVTYNRLVVPGQPDNKDIGVVYQYTVNELGEVHVLKSIDDSAAFVEYDAYDHIKQNKNNDSKKKNNKKDTKKEGTGKDKDNNSKRTEFQIDVSGDLHANTFLSRPTDRSITISTSFRRDSQYYYKYGTRSGYLTKTTEVKTAMAGSIPQKELENLDSETKYYYQLFYKDVGEETYTQSKEFYFTTQRKTGSEYIFLVEADPHLDEGFDSDTYKSILSDMLRQEPDFIIDLGDASMVEKFAVNNEEIENRNILLRSYWDNIAHSMPFYMVLGNHDGEAGWNNIGKKAIGKQSTLMRRKYFSNPIINKFYSGLSDTSYSWEWGDALFVVLDPYSFTMTKPNNQNWNWTLGKDQYDWLNNTLQQSGAKYKFVFIHNLVGGLDQYGRGGAQAASLYEWGGEDLNGTYLFDKMRSGWEKPIHQLFIDTEVDIVFHGHDHFYAREELDDIVYQLVPQPALQRKQNISNIIAEYGYTEGVFLSSPGYLRISVSPECAKVDYMQGVKGEIINTYVIEP